jgi:hypothetical protein
MVALIRKAKERPQMILVAMYKLSAGTTQLLKYEDIVVEAFRQFPDEFALRGYPEFPDSSDIHKPLYGPLKREGLIRSGNKKFGLTAKGVEQAASLINKAGDKLSLTRDARRMTRDVEREVERMLNSEAVRLFRAGNNEKILDTDFYAFVGCTVRTPMNDFLGRVKTTTDAVHTAKELRKPDEALADLLEKVWTLLRSRFATLINQGEAKAK